MSRFSKGTLDHDGDGKRGGSRKGTTMAKDTTKAPKTARTAPKSARRTSAASKEQNAALEAAAVDLASTSDPQSGGAQMIGDKPSKAAVKKALDAQFGAADAAGNPIPDDVAEATLNRQIRGY